MDPLPSESLQFIKRVEEHKRQEIFFHEIEIWINSKTSLNTSHEPPEWSFEWFSIR